MSELSVNQRNIFDFIVRFKTEHQGTAPTVREIAEACDIPTNSVVQHNLKRLQEKGYIERDPESRSRFIKVIGGQWTYTPPEQCEPVPEDPKQVMRQQIKKLWQKHKAAA